MKTKYFLVVQGVRMSVHPTWKLAQTAANLYFQFHSSFYLNNVWVESSTGLSWEVGEDEYAT